MSPRTSVGDAAPAPPRLPVPDGLTPVASTRLMAVGLSLIAAWAIVVWSTLRPQDIMSDWNSGRQADTQTIAINLARDGSNMLWPQIACGGDGPGYVETELQLYTQIIALFMGPFGAAEWIGQLISLLAVTGTAGVIWIHLGRRYGLLAGLVAVLAFLGLRTSTHLATVVMPDALALFAYVTAWAGFSRYAERSQPRDLILFAVAGTVAMLQKPTMAQLGVSSFVLLALMGRAKLADHKVWVAWTAMVAVFAAYLTHAHSLYAEYGNTFGVLFGEDGKAPHIRHLFMPQVLGGAAMNTIRWGLGQVGALAVIALVLLRRVEAEHIALAIGNVLLTLLALRYTSQDAGNYYFAPAGLLACSAIASVTSVTMRSLAGRTRQVALAAVCFLLILQLVRNVQVRHLHANFYDPLTEALKVIGMQLKGFVEPGDLVVVRSPHEAYDTFWDWPGRVCEPRIFYLSGTRGWTISRDANPQRLADAAARGARYFADPVAQESAELNTLLRASADLVWSEQGSGKIWRLHRPPGGRKP